MRFGTSPEQSPRTPASLLLLLALGSLLGLARPVRAADPLFAFAQISDSQPNSEEDWELFERVLDTLADAGTPGALLPEPVAFLLFAGDLVSHAKEQSEWLRFLDTIDARLTANDIPYRAVPGNHDWDVQDELANYEIFVGDSRVWDTDVDVVVGQNGRSAYTGWSGLRIIGFNNSNGAWNQIDPDDVASIAATADAAAAAGQNVYLLGHHPHDDEDVIPLADVLEGPAVCCYGRGHSGTVGVRRPLASIANPGVWDLNSNRILGMGAILYAEVHPGELRVYALRLDSDPTELPEPKTIGLAHALTPATVSAPVRTTILPDADAHVNSSAPTSNFGSNAELRVRAGSPTYRTYLRFPVDGLDGASVILARLRLFVNDPGSDGGALYPVGTAWSEGGITWNTAPSPGGDPIAGGVVVFENRWREIDLSSFVQGDGSYAFALEGSSSNSVLYSSREGAHPPELVIETVTPLGGPATPVPSLSPPAAVALLAALLATGLHALRRRERPSAGRASAVDA